MEKAVVVDTMYIHTTNSGTGLKRRSGRLVVGRKEGGEPLEKANGGGTQT